MVERLTKVEFTNPEKILYPEIGVKKSQVLEYYIRIAPKMLDFLEGRVIVMNRFPDGIGKKGFYEKDAPLGTPDWIKRFRKYSKASERETNYIVGHGLDTLLWLANLAVLEINVTLSKAESYNSPDLIFIDIDPEPPAVFEDAVEIALLVKEKLEDMGFTS
jgi:bifunctional non-homologous end joining protein LigD